MFRFLLVMACLCAASARADPVGLTIGQDRYEAGATLIFDRDGVGDLFMFGNRVEVAVPILGSAHLAGRRISVRAGVAGDLIAAGYAIATDGEVGGDLSAVGYELMLGPVSGNLRATGSEIIVGEVGGYALISGHEVTFSGPISGDAIVAADTLVFDSGALVAGTLTIYSADPSGIVVPDTVAPAAQVSIRPLAAYEAEVVVPVPLWRIVAGFLGGVLISGLIAALVIAIAPVSVQRWRALALAHPGHAIGSGFLVLSALAGSGFVLMLTIVGVILLPVMLILTVVAIFAGYALGAYVLGVGLWQAIGRPVPAGLVTRFGLACLGAFAAGLAWLVPVAGWFFALGLTLLGIGTLAAFVLPPRLLLRSDPASDAA